MPISGELFLSEVINKTVVDQDGEALGVITDVIVVKGDPLPILKKLLVSRSNIIYQIDYKNLNVFNRRVIAATVSRDELTPYEPADDDLLAVRDILDKQIVDINGAKVVRVNDIRLQGYMGFIVFIAVDIGMRGIMRRLGFERRGVEFLKFFKIKLDYNLISWDALQPLGPRLKSLSLKMSQNMMEKIHPADMAEIISSLSRDEGTHFFKTLDVESAAETLPELEPDTQLDIISSMKIERAAHIIKEMPPDDAVDLLNDLPRSRITEILNCLSKEDAESIEELLTHESDTAGGLMTNVYLSYCPNLTVHEAALRLKEEADEVDTIYYIYVIDDAEKLLGVISIRDFLLSTGELKLVEIMNTNVKTLTPEDDIDTVAAAFSKYNLVAIPVVDDEDRLLGIVSVDDIIDEILPPRAKRKVKKI